jgi:hypothetical protein
MLLFELPFFLFKHILFSTFSPRARLIEGDHVDLFKTLEYIVFKVPLTQFFLFILWTLLFVCNVLVKKILNLNESSKFYGVSNVA